LTKVASLFGLESLTVLWTGSCCALHRPRGEIKSLRPLPSRCLHVLPSRRLSCLFRRLGRFQVRDSRFLALSARHVSSESGRTRDFRAAAPPARLPSGERPRPDRAGCLLSGLGPWPLPFGTGPVRPTTRPSGPQLRSRWGCPPPGDELSESRVPTVTGQIVRRSIRLRASPRRPAGVPRTSEGYRAGRSPGVWPGAAARRSRAPSGAAGAACCRRQTPWLTGRQFPRSVPRGSRAGSVPRGSRAVSSPGQFPMAHGPSASESAPWRTGRQFPEAATQGPA